MSKRKSKKKPGLLATLMGWGGPRGTIKGIGNIGTRPSSRPWVKS